MTIAYVVLKTGQPDQEPCPLPISEHHRQHKAKQLARKLQHLGYDVTITPKAA